MMNSTQELKHVELEIISKQNPITFNMSNYSNIMGLELEQFYYKPNGAAPTNFIGVRASGSRGRYNEAGLQMDVLKTVPLVNSAYNFQDASASDEGVRYMNNGTDLVITFIDRNTPSLNPSLITFDNNYLLNMTLYVL